MIWRTRLDAVCESGTARASAARFHHLLTINGAGDEQARISPATSVGVRVNVADDKNRIFRPLPPTGALQLRARVKEASGANSRCAVIALAGS